MDIVWWNVNMEKFGGMVDVNMDKFDWSVYVQMDACGGLVDDKMDKCDGWKVMGQVLVDRKKDNNVRM